MAKDQTLPPPTYDYLLDQPLSHTHPELEQMKFQGGFGGSGGNGTGTGEKGDKGDTGDQGPAGADGADGADGAPGTQYPWKGAYSSGTTYAVNDCVQYNGSGYVCIQAGSNKQPDTQPTYWDLLVQKGATGAAGAPGAPGEGFTFVETVPEYSDDPGTAGDVAYDVNFIYFCVASDSWIRSARETFDIRPTSFIRSITIDHTKCGSGNSTDYTFLFKGTYNGTEGILDLRTVANGGKVEHANGYDITFYADAAKTTPLKFERVYWEGTTGECIFLVKIPTLHNASDDVIYISYGDDGITTDQQDVANTYNSNILQVNHFEGNSNASKGYNGTDSSMSYGTSYGKFRQGAHFTGGGKIDLGNTDLNPNAMTISMWIRPTAFTNDYARIYTKEVYGVGQIFIGIRNNGHMVWYIDAGGSVYNLSGSAALSLNNWYKVTMMYDSTSGLKGYVGTSEDASVGANGVCKTINGHTYLGTDPDNSNPYYVGDVDQLKVWNKFLGTDWLTAEYNNESNPTTFYTIGSET